MIVEGDSGVLVEHEEIGMLLLVFVVFRGKLVLL